MPCCVRMSFGWTNVAMFLLKINKQPPIFSLTQNNRSFFFSLHTSFEFRFSQKVLTFFYAATPILILITFPFSQSGFSLSFLILFFFLIPNFFYSCLVFFFFNLSIFWEFTNTYFSLVVSTLKMSLLFCFLQNHVFLSCAFSLSFFLFCFSISVSYLSSKWDCHIYKFVFLHQKSLFYPLLHIILKKLTTSYKFVISAIVTATLKK